MRPTNGTKAPPCSECQGKKVKKLEDGKEIPCPCCQSEEAKKKAAESANKNGNNVIELNGNNNNNNDDDQSSDEDAEDIERLAKIQYYVPTAIYRSQYRYR